MAIIKKPAAKMQDGGKVKIKIKIKPDRKQAREDKDKLPLMKNPLREAEMKSKKSSLDKSVKDAGFKKGGIVKAKNGKSFPDLNKDGKITKADILKGRGVIAKKGSSVKKAQNGAKARFAGVTQTKPSASRDSTSYFKSKSETWRKKATSQLDAADKLGAYGAPERAEGLQSLSAAKKYSKDVERQKEKGMPGKTSQGYPKSIKKVSLKNKVMKSGGKMSKCKYGCN